MTSSRDRDSGPSAAERAASAARNAAANRAASKAVKEQQDAGRTESISQKISRGGGFADGGKVNSWQREKFYNNGGIVGTLKQREGFSDTAYLDTEGNWTIGYGTTSVDGRPVKRGDTITREKAETELNKDINTARQDAAANVRNFHSLPSEVQDALTNQAYQLGGAGQADFKNMIGAIEAGDYDTAIAEAQNSRWATQTPKRVQDLVSALVGATGKTGGGFPSFGRIHDWATQDPIATVNPDGTRNVGVGPKAGFWESLFTPGGGVKDPRPDDIINRTGKTRAETQEDNLAAAAGIPRSIWNRMTQYDRDQAGGGQSVSGDRADAIRRDVNNPASQYYNHYINRKARGEEWKSGNVSPAVSRATQAVHDAARSSSADNWTKNVHAAQVAKVKAQQAAGLLNNGGKVGYYEYGGANKATHPGEPRGSDTVPAWLTEGEYVADKDSTEVFEPVLKAINDWEPGMPYDEVLRAMDEFIKMSNNREMDDAVYKQFGGFINNLVGQGGQAPTLGRDLRNRALQARDARVRGALLQGGLGTQGRAHANQAGLITQAGGGLGRSFTPGGDTLDPLGEGLQGRAEAEAQYQDELGSISQAEFDRAEAERIRQEDITREDAYREEQFAREDAKLEADLQEAEDKAYKDEREKKEGKSRMMNLAEEAILELNKGAGKVLNFAVSAAVRKAVRATGLVVIRASNSQQSVHDYIQETMPEVINHWFQNNDQASLSSFTRFKTAIYSMYVEGRKDLSGQGQITEKESALIYETIASLDNNSDSLASALQNLINRIAKQIGVETKEVPYSSVSPFGGRPSLGDLGLDAGLSANLKGSGTTEDPYLVPKTKVTKKSVLAWLDEQNLPDDAIITWKKITGTVAQLREYLQK